MHIKPLSRWVFGTLSLETHLSAPLFKSDHPSSPWCTPDPRRWSYLSTTSQWSTLLRPWLKWEVISSTTDVKGLPANQHTLGQSRQGRSKELDRVIPFLLSRAYLVIFFLFFWLCRPCAGAEPQVVCAITLCCLSLCVVTCDIYLSCFSFAWQFCWPVQLLVLSWLLLQIVMSGA
jgi:hypothetical protein